MAKDTQYVSDTTKFLNSLFEKDPSLQQKQAILRSTWWNVGAKEHEEQEKLHQTDLKTNAYAYYSYPSCK